MFIKVNKDSKVIEISSVKKAGFLDEDFDIDRSKLMFAKIVNNKIVYDEKNYKKHIKNRDYLINLANEMQAIEDWFKDYDKVINEHLRCERLEIQCHHNIAEWDKQALIKAQRIKEIKAEMNLK